MGWLTTTSYHACMKRVSWRRPALLVVISIWAVTAPIFAADSKPPPDAEVRKAVERSLPYLEREGVAWIEKHDCISCHHVSFLLWSHNAAKSAGIAVDQAKLV